MNQDKMHLINKIFNNETIRTVWDKEKEKYTKRNGNSTEQNTERFMTEYPVHPRIIKTI